MLRAKRRLGALTLMDLLWSVLNHGNLPSPNCAALYHRDGSSCVSSKIKYYGCYHCTLLLYHHNGAKHQRKELPAASPAPSPLPPARLKFTITCMQSKVYISKFSKFTLQVQVHNNMYAIKSLHFQIFKCNTCNIQYMSSNLACFALRVLSCTFINFATAYPFKQWYLI